MIKSSVNLDIALTHIVTRRKQTMVAALGVTIGVAIYLFMNSLSSGFSKFSRDEIFKVSAHIKIYKSDEMSESIVLSNDSQKNVIVNPQITTLSYKLTNPDKILLNVKAQPYVTKAIAEVNFDAFYNKGNAQVKGSGVGADMLDYDAMFNLKKYIVAGSIEALQSNLNAVIIGSGIAEKLSLSVNDNVTITSSYQVSKVMKIVGIFKTGSNINDNSKCYTNISAAQQFQKQGPSYVSTIYLNTLNADKTDTYVKQLQQLTEYTVEDWKTTNADVLSGDKVRGTMMKAISLSILLVAAFGIYNILSATISQKINDIAILKATGFSGLDVVKVFVSEALIMGIIGTFIGIGFGSVLIQIMKSIYIGGPVGYFPINFEPTLFAMSLGLGILITLCAGYFPAKKLQKLILLKFSENSYDK